jgi:hypothetical protein
MSELLKINVNGHTERKGNLTYLSWAWAWAEVLKIDPGARWTAHEWDNSPVMCLRNGTAMVKVSVEIKSDIKTCILPVMDNRNRAIVDPDAFAVNTAIMRCLAKAIAMHGLGPSRKRPNPTPRCWRRLRRRLTLLRSSPSSSRLTPPSAQRTWMRSAHARRS